LPGRHNVQNALAAIAVASLFRISALDCSAAFSSFQNLHQRGEILILPGEVTVINDCYNSNPLAMERMLEVLAGWPKAHRRVVVAGEMLELGSTSPELHRSAGRRCAQSGVAWLISVQGDARFFVEGAVEAGIPESHTRFFPNAQSAGEFCRTLIAPGDVVLVKGSRAVHLETVVELLQRQ
jgi:UDP-N-acetylmuramoyl-tripeptide--D-alanyl-D-alanine ligase